LIGSKEQVYFSVVVEVTGTNSATIIKIHVLEKVELGSIRQLVTEINSSSLAIQNNKKGMADFFLFVT
jgi:hypothetical protein